MSTIWKKIGVGALAISSFQGYGQEGSTFTWTNGDDHQTAQVKCGCGRAHARLLELNPNELSEIEALRLWTKSFKQSGERSSYTIPVVFHVNDDVNPYKVTAAQIQSAIDILNEDYNGANPEFNNLRPEFQSIAANVQIQFCLATKDPQGNPTSGITYHYNNYNGEEPDGTGSTVKHLSGWPGNKYLNIWVVDEVFNDGDLYGSGWAYRPSSWADNNDVDGIMYNHRYLGYTGSSDVTGPSDWQAHMARVLTHEVGHYLNLHHTFENYCSAPGDEVADTPPVYYHGSNNCQQLGTLCSGVTVVNDENYMDYTPCSSMFTEGQKTRMHAALNSSVAGRNNLWSSGNLIATGCNTVSSVNDITITDMQISPNPFESRFTINMHLTGQDDVAVTILNTLGETVWKKDNYHVQGHTTIEVNDVDLPVGLYVVSVTTKGGNVMTTKLIKN